MKIEEIFTVENMMTNFATVTVLSRVGHRIFGTLLNVWINLFWDNGYGSLGNSSKVKPRF